MLAEDPILVTGATGNTGSTLLQQLEARGARLPRDGSWTT
jgi:nucleoside-diphosphate-sugar epimerase